MEVLLVRCFSVEVQDEPSFCVVDSGDWEVPVEAQSSCKPIRVLEDDADPWAILMGGALPVIELGIDTASDVVLAEDNPKSEVRE